MNSIWNSLTLFTSKIPGWPLMVLIILAALLPAATYASEVNPAARVSAPFFLFPPATGQGRPHRAVGDPVPRVQCPAGYTATIYAEGLSSPDGLALSPTGVLHVAEESAGQVSRIEADGSATPVLTGLSNPEGIAFDSAGNLYVVEDVANGRLLKQAPDGTTTTLATNLDAPEGIVWTPGGTLYFTESNAELVQSFFDIKSSVGSVLPPGAAATLRTDNWFWSYAGITANAAGMLYLTNEASGTGTTDSIFTVNPNTSARTLLASNLTSPEGLRFTATGNFPLFVAEEDTGGGSGQITQVDSNGSHTPLCTGFFNIEDVETDLTRRIYVSEDTSGLIILIEPPPAPVDSIILLIGDGMAQAQRTAARWSAGGQYGLLAMDSMSFHGESQTASANSSITDSAAGGTAIATGVKTNNGMVGQDPAGNNLTSILEQAQARGMAVGLVTTTQMTHATPASFAAHVPSRYMMTEIASQMLAAGVDVLLGGGEDEFLPTTETGCYPEAGERNDGRNLISEATAAGYTYVCDAAGLAAIDPASTSRLLGLFADEGMVRPFSPSLVDMTQKAIDILSQDPDGFFLVVEGGQIDWAGHANSATNTIGDTLDFDQAVAAGKTYASSTGNTLVIVTADHETGGMSTDLTSSDLPNEDGPLLMPDSTPFYINWTTFNHTGVNVPTTALGPWSNLLTGTYENTHIHDVMLMALGPTGGTIGDYAWIDTNGNGQPDSGESGLSGITVFLDQNNNGSHNSGEPSDTSDSSGDYDLLGLASGIYTVTLDSGTIPAGYTLTTANNPLTITLTENEDYNNADFGFQPRGTVSAHLFVDTNGNGTQNSGEPDLPGVTVLITDTLGAGQSKTTNASGNISATVPAGSTSLDVDQSTLPAGYILTTANDPQSVSVTAGSTTAADDVGFQPLTSAIGDFVWYDSNGNGQPDESGSGIAGLTVYLDQNSNGSRDTGEPSANSDSSGVYTISNLAAGIYTVTVDSNTIPTGYQLTTANEPLIVTLTANQHYRLADFGYIHPPNLSITKIATPASGTELTPGEWITYTVRVSNSGGPAHNVLITDIIPAGTVYVPFSPASNLGSTSFDGKQLTIQVPDFSTGAILTATIPVTVNTNLEVTLVNTALLYSPQAGQVSSNPVSHRVRPSFAPAPEKSIFLPILFKQSPAQ